MVTRASVVAFTALILLQSFANGALAAYQATASNRANDSAVDEPGNSVWDNGRIVERPPVDFGTPSAGGDDEAGPAFDPSIGLSPSVERVAPPKDPLALLDQWTENTRTTALPDGTFELSAATGRLNFQDATGGWHEIDLSLIPDSSDGLGFRTTANDRLVTMGIKSADDKLASLSTTDGSISVRALDFPSTSNVAIDATGIDNGQEPAGEVKPAQSSAPAASTAPLVEPSPLALVEPSPGPSSAPELPVPSGVASPAATVAPEASAEPEPTPAPTATQDPQAPAPAIVPPADGILRFTKNSDTGEIFVRANETGFEFGATLDDPTQATTYAFAIELGSLQAVLGPDGRTILLSGTEAKDGSARLVGGISAPVLLDADEIPAPAETVRVTLFAPGASAVDGISDAARLALSPTEAVVVYSIDPAWLATTGRAFPVVLDPDACLGAGASGCPILGDDTNFDHFVMSGLPSTYPSGWTVVRVGDDSISTDSGEWGNLRGLFYFADVTLPDGAVVYDTNLKLHVSSVHGSVGETVKVYRVNDPWSQTTTWNGWSSGAGYDSATGDPTATDTVPSSGSMNFDVDGIVQSWYTRRAKDWKPDIGFAVRQVDETTGETQFDRYNDATAANRPLLVIHYLQAEPAIDFDAKLGANYSPSTMIAGQATTLPIVVTNRGSVDFTTTEWKVGYRFFDAKGVLAGSGSQALTQCIGVGSGCVPTSATIGLAVTPPATTGQYTLLLDVVRITSDSEQYVSDYATPSKFYSRNKKVLSADNTRWTGSSLVERDEFSIAVVNGGGDSGNVKSIPTADGATLSIDLWSKNLSYAGTGGEGFSDLIALGAGYEYNSKNVTDCAGILKACGWSTTYDERFIETAGTTFTYVDPSGTRHLVDNDADQQLVSGAPVLLQRPRATLFDEQVPSVCCTEVSLVLPGGESPSFSPVSGQYVLRTKYASSSAGYKDLGYNRDTNLNSFRQAGFAIHTSGATSAAVGFQIKNVTKNTFDWFVYTLGPSSWSAGDDSKYLGTLSSGWTYKYENLYTDVRDGTTFGDLDDEYRVDDMRVYFKSGLSGTNYTYLDAVRLESTQSDILEDAEPLGDWSGNGSAASLVVGDAAEGTKAIKVTPASISGSPDCVVDALAAPPCWGSGDGKLWTYGFIHWQWKKVGGNRAAIVFHLKNERSGAAGDLTYYAGAVPPPGAVNPIRVSDMVPSDWSKVTINLLQDARQVLGFYKDDPKSTSASSPPTQGPTPDQVRMTGYRLVASDGNFLLIDDFDNGSLPDVGSDQVTHPTSSSDTTFTYDFTATYADGSVHYFNTRGLLTRIANRDGQHVDFDWSIPDPTVYGGPGFRLNTIHAATDGTTASGLTYDRELQLTYSAPGNPRTVTIAERLASTGTGGQTLTGRSTIFTVDTNGDVTKIKPARAPSCAASGSASGCVILSYAGSHLLTTVADPRWNQTATTGGANDLRYDITWTSSEPMAISDRSQSSVTPLIKVLDYDVGGSILPASRRVAWQDAAGLRKDFGRYEDITSDGKPYVTYIPLTCTTACSSSNLPSISSISTKKISESEFDGLARVSKTIAYRCPGTVVSGCGSTAEKVVSRQGTKAGAKVNNYNDPLTAGEIEWSQSPDQYVASLRDSGGLDPDLYRTFFTYDENGLQVSAARPVHNERPDYQGAVKSTATTSVVGYWRLGDSSGAPMTDSSGNGRNGTYGPSLSYGGAGALVGDTNKSVAFPGSSHGSVTSAVMGTVSGSFTVEAWVKPATTSGTIVYVGSRNATGGSSFELKDGTTIHGVIGNGSTYVSSNADATFAYAAGRWYHIVYVLTSGNYTIYANGVVVGGGTFTGAGVLTDATHALYVGSNGTGTYWNGSIDEAAVYQGALSPQQVEAHYLAGRSIALQTTQTQYNSVWKPIQVDDQMVLNPGFESGSIGWSAFSGTIISAGSLPDSRVHQPADPSLPHSWQSFSTGISGSAQQDVQLLPGQTFRVQFWETRATANAASANVTLQYWKRSTGAWANWPGWAGTFVSGSAWAGHAWDVTLPFDTDGRVRLKLGVTGAVSGGTVYYDDAGIFSVYSRTTYTAGGSGTFAGLVADTFTFSPSGAGPDAELQSHSAYAASAAHPAIFVTKQTANWDDGAFNPTNRDVDVTTTTAYDGWGHVVSLTDQDGVAALTSYVSSSSTNGYATDIASTTNLLGEATSYLYNQVGLRIRVTAPSADYTTTDYDLVGHATKVTAPSPVSTIKVSVYDRYGFMTDEIVNWVDGTPTTSGLDDVVTTFVYDEFGMQTRTTQNTGVTGAVGARTESLHDLLGNITSTTTYSTYDGTTFGGARTTTSHIERVSDVGGGYAVRSKPSAIRGPGAFAPASGTSCPDGSGLFCNTVTKLDQDGQSIATTDVYGKTTKTLLDFAGEPTISIANYEDGVYVDTNPDRDLISLAFNDLFGRPTVVVAPKALQADADGRMTTTTYDALGRATSVTVTGSNGTVGSQTRTVYTAAGRVDRTSLPGAALVGGTPALDSTFTWTKTVYDKAGRATKTLAHFDPGGNAGLALDSFETPVTDITIDNDGVAESWAGGAGTFNAGGTISRDGAASSAKAGGSRLAVTTGTGGNAGAEWALDGTFVSTHVYKARVWVWAPTSTQVTAKLGVAADSAAATTPVSGNNDWQPLDVTWTAGSNVSGVKLAVFRSGAASSVTFYLDEAAVWDSNTSATDVNVPIETAYDTNSRVVASIVPPGSVGGAEVSMVTRTVYDVLGRATSVNVNEVAGAGTSPSDVNLTTQSHYDALGRADTSTDPTGTVTKFDFDRLGRTIATTLNYEAGAPTSTTTSDDVASTYAYDAAGELVGYCSAVQVNVTGCDPAASANVQAWHYVYDDAGHMVLQTPPVKTQATLTQLASTRWEYDAGGRILRTCDLNAGTATCSAASGVLRTVIATYDEVGRTTRNETRTGNSSGTLALRSDMKYLGDGQKSETKYSEGTTPTVKDTLTYEYDTFGRQTKILRGTVVLSKNAYSDDDTLASRTDGDDPTGSSAAIGTSSYQYDWAKRLTQITVPSSFSASTTASVGWRLDGLVKSRTWSSGSAAAFSYDGAKRPTELAKGSDWLRQTFDRDGNVKTESRSLTSVTGDPGTGTQTFNYDPLNRVTSSTGLSTAANRTYTYDRDGNRLTKVEGGVTTFTATYDRTDQLVKVNKGTGDVTFAYDALGNMTSNAETAASVTAYTYDAGNKLSAIAGPGGTADDAAFDFDALGRFLTRTVDTAGAAKKDTYSYAGASETVLRISNVVGATTVNTDSIVTPTGDRVGVAVSGTVNWLLPDLHGNVAGALSANEATVVNAIRYDAYGQMIATGTAGGTAVGANAWKYQGKLDISPTSQPLYDMSARFYSPGIGAFTQVDSVMGSAQNPRSMNRFLYAEANPATLIDPTGHMALEMDSGGTIFTPTSTKQALSGPAKTTYSGTAARPRPVAPAPLRVSVADDTRSESIAATRADHEWAAAMQTAVAPPKRDCGWLPCFDLPQINININIDPHAVLDVVGMLPIVGTGADILNAGLYAAEGDWGNAALSMVSAVPLVGDAIGAGKLALKYGDNAVAAAGFIASHVDEAAEVVSGVAHYGDEAAEVASSAAKVADDVGTSVIKHGDDLPPPAVLPAELTKGANAQGGVDVYRGLDSKGKDVYAGITNDVGRRGTEHGARFPQGLETLTQSSGAVSRGEARAIEQALIVRAGGVAGSGARSSVSAYQNVRNSISPSRPYYEAAVSWGEQWLRGAGH